MRLVPFLIGGALLAIRVAGASRPASWRAMLALIWPGILSWPGSPSPPPAWPSPPTARTARWRRSTMCRAARRLVHLVGQGLRDALAAVAAELASRRDGDRPPRRPSPTTNGRSRAPICFGAPHRRGTLPRRSVADRPARRVRQVATPGRSSQALASFPREAFDYVWTIDLRPEPRPRGYEPVWQRRWQRALCKRRLGQIGATGQERPMTALSIVVPCFNEQECLPDPARAADRRRARRGGRGL